MSHLCLGDESLTVGGRVLVVIVNYRTDGLTVNCQRSIEPDLVRIVGSHGGVVEIASGDGDSLGLARREDGWEGWVDLDVADRNGRFSYGNNRVVRTAPASAHPLPSFLLLTRDTEVRTRDRFRLGDRPHSLAYSLRDTTQARPGRTPALRRLLGAERIVSAQSVGRDREGDELVRRGRQVRRLGLGMPILRI